MNFKWPVRSCLTAAALLLAAGCYAPNTTGLTTGVAVDEQGILQTYISAENPKLAKRLTIQDVQTRQTANGLMKVSVTVTSNRKKTMNIQSKFAWFDADGAEIAPDADPWRVLVLEGRETRIVTGVAPTPAAESFRLRIREADRAKKYVQ